ncbi:hypothetical protein FB567DRAFT_571898 [Paraphoma chrysanthemicola]|uniref:Uncharacterized protein n=1 Tax=Paraphoma chrysanthemicola TaxID=798071 RepID=A0A8K0QXD3_9PLEO|nr:hypothetical protein FB567DRAFT_571898 [Paraphoma chrysanthemicola]
MGLSSNFIEMARLSPQTDSPPYNFANTNFNDNPQNATADEHPAIDIILKAILAFRLQTAAHFEIDISVYINRIIPVDTETREGFLDPSLRVEVELGDFTRRIPATFRPRFRKARGTGLPRPMNKIEVFENGRTTSVNNFLAKQFPIFPDRAVMDTTMQAWWNANGQRFGWADLPTEIKENVIRFCMHAPPAQDQYSARINRHRNRFARLPGDQPGREPGIYEILDQFSNWASLLGVSHQVRAIALRLCLKGTSEMPRSKGFCLFANSYEKLDNALYRLGQYYQMIEPNSLPIDDKSRALAQHYKHYPIIYPHLQKYATFAQGLQKVSLYMDFLSSMHFFKVTIGGFERYWWNGRMTYEVFFQLPHLKEIEIRLPLQPRDGWNDYPAQRGPRLFYHVANQACPRILHRVIYEQIAEVLALYPYVRVKNFGDDDEQARFYELRDEARKNVKFTRKDLDDLYAECGGGIQLDEPVEQKKRSWATPAAELLN